MVSRAPLGGELWSSWSCQSRIYPAREILLSDFRFQHLTSLLNQTSWSSRHVSSLCLFENTREGGKADFSRRTRGRKSFSQLAFFESFSFSVICSLPEVNSNEIRKLSPLSSAELKCNLMLFSCWNNYVEAKVRRHLIHWMRTHYASNCSLYSLPDDKSFTQMSSKTPSSFNISLITGIKQVEILSSCRLRCLPRSTRAKWNKLLALVDEARGMKTAFQPAHVLWRARNSWGSTVA